MPRGVPNKQKVTDEVISDMGVVTEVVPEIEEPEIAVQLCEAPCTLDDAFRVLCKALLNEIEELPDVARIRDIQIRFTDGHKKMAWQQIWAVTEGVVGVPY